MIRLFLLMFFSVLLTGCVGKRAFPSLEGNRTVIVENGQSRWVIAIAPNADCCEQFAANELQRYIAEITGAKLPVMESTTVQTDLQSLILLGKGASSAHTPEHFRAISWDQLGSDGYIIESISSSKLLLAGGTSRGTLYSVYHFLELLGCRWFYPDVDPNDRVIPKTNTLYVGQVAINTTPSFKYRMVYLHSFLMEDRSLWLKQIDWAAKLRLNYIGILEQISPKQLDDYFVRNGMAEELNRRGLKINALGHSLHFFLPAEKYFEEHPEWFCMRDGQRTRDGNFCLSNTQAVDVFVERVVSFARSYPFVGIVSLWAGDGAAYCQCQNCLLRTSTDNYFALITRVAEEFQKEGIDKPVEALVGYDATIELPASVGKLPPNVILMGAQYHRVQSYAKTSPWTEWKKRFANEFCTFEYHADYNNNRSFEPLPARIVQDIWYLKKIGASGVEICLFRGVDWRMQVLNACLLARMLWDARIPPM